MRVISFGVLTALFAFLGWLIVVAQVNRCEFWKVELMDLQQLTVNVGDMILAKSRTLPLVPANLQKIFEVTYDHSCLRLIAEEPAEADGRLGRQFYFLVLEKGISEVTVRIKEEDRILETLKLSVTSR